MEHNSIKPRLLALLRDAHAVEQRFMAELSETERVEAGTMPRWSAKDLLAHITFWRARLTRALAGWARGEAMPSNDQVDEMNAETFEKNRQRSFDEIEAEAERVFDEFIAQVSQFNQEQFADPTPIGWYTGRSLQAAIIGNSYTHPLTHLAYFYIERGNLLRGKEITESTWDALVDFDNSPTNRGLARYNLACFYALNGETARAIELLREALSLHADLVEWSKQDTDLNSLRELPEYRALYER